MTLFDDKEKAEENKYAHNKEVDFIVHARRNQLLGEWVASKMGLDADEAHTYAMSFKTLALSSHNDAEVIAKVRGDLLAKDINVSDHDIRSHLHFLENEARAKVMQG